MTPLRDTVRLIDRKEGYLDLAKELDVLSLAERLGSYIE